MRKFLSVLSFFIDLTENVGNIFRKHPELFRKFGRMFGKISAKYKFLKIIQFGWKFPDNSRIMGQLTLISGFWFLQCVIYDFQPVFLENFIVQERLYCWSVISINFMIYELSTTTKAIEFNYLFSDSVI